VLVTIEEPHMYYEDDAVAKLDGYVVSVAGAGRLIGKRTLVRIEKVARSAASATLVEGAEVAEASQRANGASDRGAGSGGEDGAPRRRGSRGGRGRRRKPAQSEATGGSSD
jgi:ribonuclease G